MSELAGKHGLIVGIANKRSIAWAIAEAVTAAGARLAVTYQGERLEENVRELSAALEDPLMLPCDVTNDEQLDAVFAAIDAKHGGLDFVVHGVAFADREDLARPFSETSRDGFARAMDISVYSLTALVKEAEAIMNDEGSILTMTYYGSQKVMPNYNVMGVAKAALEASVRYLAYDLGPRGIRVNAISAGPIRTLAAAGVSGFKDYYRTFKGIAPLHRNVTIGDIGNTALWLCSDLSTAVTGAVVYVDAGFNILGVGQME